MDDLLTEQQRELLKRFAHDAHTSAVLKAVFLRANAYIGRRKCDD